MGRPHRQGTNWLELVGQGPGNSQLADHVTTDRRVLTLCFSAKQMLAQYLPPCLGTPWMVPAAAATEAELRLSMWSSEQGLSWLREQGSTALDISEQTLESQFPTLSNRAAFYISSSIVLISPHLRARSQRNGYG